VIGLFPLTGYRNRVKNCSLSITLTATDQKVEKFVNKAILPTITSSERQRALDFFLGGGHTQNNRLCQSVKFTLLLVSHKIFWWACFAPFACCVRDTSSRLYTPWLRHCQKLEQSYWRAEHWQQILSERLIVGLTAREVFFLLKCSNRTTKIFP